MRVFKAPKESLSGLDAEMAATLLVTAADIAVVIDDEGVITDLAFQRTDLSSELEGYGRFVGRHFGETVTAESQSKVSALLREASERPRSSWRQVSHPTILGVDIPILYCAVKLTNDNFILIGRDQRAIATLQQRLIEAQMLVERDYSRLRHNETRYRILFQVSAEPVFIVDAANESVLEANPSALELFGDHKKRVVGRAISDLFGVQQAKTIRTLLAGVLTTGREQTISVQESSTRNEIRLSALLFRQDTSRLFLMRVTMSQGPEMAALPSPQSKLLQLAEHALDGFVVTDVNGRVIAANRAFMDMTQLTAESQIKGEPLDRWLGRLAVDFSVLTASLRENGSVKLFATMLRGEYGEVTAVEVSATTIPGDDIRYYGFVIRNVDRRLRPAVTDAQQIPRSVEQLTGLIGRVPLREIVRETTDVIERLCIEAALNITGDNRASAAEMLGLSRQSLYVKLRRYGLSDLSVESES